MQRKLEGAAVRILYLSVAVNGALFFDSTQVFDCIMCTVSLSIKKSTQSTNYGYHATRRSAESLVNVGVYHTTRITDMRVSYYRDNGYGS